MFYTKLFTQSELVKLSPANLETREIRPIGHLTLAGSTRKQVVISNDTSANRPHPSAFIP